MCVRACVHQVKGVASSVNSGMKTRQQPKLLMKTSPSTLFLLERPTGFSFFLLDFCGGIYSNEENQYGRVNIFIYDTKNCDSDDTFGLRQKINICLTFS